MYQFSRNFIFKGKCQFLITFFQQFFLFLNCSSKGVEGRKIYRKKSNIFFTSLLNVKFAIYTGFLEYLIAKFQQPFRKLCTVTNFRSFSAVGLDNSFQCGKRYIVSFKQGFKTHLATSVSKTKSCLMFDTIMDKEEYYKQHQFL